LFCFLSLSCWYHCFSPLRVSLLGETDHKIIVLRADDPIADEINTLRDLERHHPNVISMLVDWLKNYKTSDGKPVNKLRHEEPLSAEKAKALITETHEFYKALIAKKDTDEHGYSLI
jgi:3'-phosphoadenosine 5'-phosphosulfate synthase